MKKNNINDKFIFNEHIKFKEVRLKDEDDSMIGPMSMEDANKIAEERDLDLVLLTSNQKPAIIRLCDRKQFLYKHKKKQQEIRKKQSNIELQEIQLGLFIDDNDINHKIEKIKKILIKGNKIKLFVRLRKRYRDKQDLAQKVIEKVIKILDNMCKIEKDVVKDTHMVWCICLPNKSILQKNT